MLLPVAGIPDNKMTICFGTPGMRSLFISDSGIISQIASRVFRRRFRSTAVTARRALGESTFVLASLAGYVEIMLAAPSLQHPEPTNVWRLP